jgi:hypothetical protein
MGYQVPNRHRTEMGGQAEAGQQLPESHECDTRYRSGTDLLEPWHCHWEAETDCVARLLFPNGQVLVTESSGQVCFLNLYEGNRMIALGDG